MSLKKVPFRILGLCLVAVLAVAGLTACGQSGNGQSGDASGDKTIKIGASPTPHAEILNNLKEQAKEDGYTLDVVEYNDYIQPNTALEDGQLDANYFQHITYLNDFNQENGTHLVDAADIHFEPFCLYAGKTASLDALPDGAVVAVPNDTTNEARALLLLQQEGLIKLKDGAGLNATVVDIVENPKNLQIQQMEAPQLPRSLQDVDIAAINGNFALGAGLKTEDALATESDTGEASKAYVNVLAVKDGNQDSEKTKELVKLLTSDQTRQFIEDNYNGGVVAVF